VDIIVLIISTALDVPKKNFCCFICVSYGTYTLLQNDSFFYIYICSFSTKFILQMYNIAQAYLRCCHVAKRMEAILEYYLQFQFGNRRY